MVEKLLPCPFCGGKPEFRRSGRRGHYVACTGCDASSTLFTAAKDDVRELLIETWNRRVIATGAGFDHIVAARKGVIDATAAYNARLEFVQAERKRGNWLNVDPEYAAMSEAQSIFYRIVIEAADTALAAKGGEHD